MDKNTPRIGYGWVWQFDTGGYYGDYNDLPFVFATREEPENSMYSPGKAVRVEIRLLDAPTNNNNEDNQDD